MVPTKVLIAGHGLGPVATSVDFLDLLRGKISSRLLPPSDCQRLQSLPAPRRSRWASFFRRRAQAFDRRIPAPENLVWLSMLWISSPTRRFSLVPGCQPLERRYCCGALSSAALFSRCPPSASPVCPISPSSVNSSVGRCRTVPTLLRGLGRCVVLRPRPPAAAVSPPLPVASSKTGDGWHFAPTADRHQTASNDTTDLAFEVGSHIVRCRAKRKKNKKKKKGEKTRRESCLAWWSARSAPAWAPAFCGVDPPSTTSALLLCRGFRYICASVGEPRPGRPLSPLEMPACRPARPRSAPARKDRPGKIKFR